MTLCFLLEAVNEFNYLGLIVNYNEKFGNIVDVQVQVFDSMISPILLYGSEVWGYDVMLSCLIFHISLTRWNAKLKMSTPTTMVMGELETSHIENMIYSRTYNYLGKMVRGQQ